jgi:hypothetical protein
MPAARGRIAKREASNTVGSIVRKVTGATFGSDGCTNHHDPIVARQSSSDTPAARWK